MTCYWSGIQNALNKHNLGRIHNETKCTFLKKRCFKNVQGGGEPSVPPLENLILFLQQHNTIKHNILWNGKELSLNERKENFLAIRDYNIKGIYNGHLCSACDYFLFLIAHVFCVNIDHYYLGRLMQYKNPKATTKLIFKSNKGHFWCVLKKN